MKTRLIFLFLVLLFNQLLFSQIKNIYPFKSSSLDYNQEDEINFYKSIENCDSILKAVSTEEIYESLSETQQKQLEVCDRETYNYYDVSELGCSWYCGGGPDSVYASSTLKSSKNFSYEAINVGDGDHSTAWVEGSKGNGIGDWIEFRFGYYSPRVTTLIITNGYVKSEKAYLENSRAKKIKVIYEGKTWAYVNLSDYRSDQYFNVDTLGHRFDKTLDSKAPKYWTLRLEVVEIYPGTKYSDLAITEIGFDGIDVHCLAAGTKVLLADSSLKNIEELAIGDFIWSYNERSNIFEKDEILELSKAWHKNLYTIHFEDGSEITITDDHPIWNSKRWESLNPEKSKNSYSFAQVYPLNLESIQGKKVIRLEKNKDFQMTYTIVRLRKNSSFIANTLIVGTETLN